MWNWCFTYSHWTFSQQPFWQKLEGNHRCFQRSLLRFCPILVIRVKMLLPCMLPHYGILISLLHTCNSMSVWLQWKQSIVWACAAILMNWAGTAGEKWARTNAKSNAVKISPQMDFTFGETCNMQRKSGRGLDLCAKFGRPTSCMITRFLRRRIISYSKVRVEFDTALEC